MRWVVCLSLLFFSACAFEQGFGQVLAEPACADWDAWCRGQDLGTRVAEGATLDLRLGSRTTLTSGEDVTLESSEPSILLAEGRTIRGVSPGTAVLLFRSRGRLVEFTHVTVESVVDVALYRAGAAEPEPFPSTLALAQGESLRIRAVPLGRSGPLLGDIETAFTVTGSDALTVTAGTREVERVLEGSAPGEAVLSVLQRGLEDSLSVNVR